MSTSFEQCKNAIEYLKAVEISVKSDFIHADKSEGFIFRPINDKDKNNLFVVKQDGVVSGAVVVRNIQKDDYKMFKNFAPMPNALILDKLVVKLWHRNLGLATGLIEYVLNTFANPLYAIVRVSPENNIPTHKIMKKFGFEQIAQTEYFNKEFNDNACWALYQHLPKEETPLD